MRIKSSHRVGFLIPSLQGRTLTERLGASNQAGFIKALNLEMSDVEYNNLLKFARNRCGPQGIDKVLEENEVDIIMGPGDGPLFCISGTAGK
jgi:amidase